MKPRLSAKPFSATPALMAGFMLLAMVAALPMLFAARERANNAAAQTALMIEAHLSDTFSTMREAENALRGYLITGSSISMHNYNASLAAAPRELATLNDMLAHSKDAALMAKVRQLDNIKLATLSATMALIRAGDKPAATAMINRDLNSGTMFKLHQLIDQMRLDEQQRLTAAEAQAAAYSWIMLGLIAAAVVGTILLAWLVIAQANAANSALEGKIAERTATLRASEARFRLLSESLPGLVYMTDAEGKTVYVNPQSCEYTGLRADEMLVFGWVAMVHPDDREHCIAQWEHSLATGANYEIEYRIRRHDGQFRWFIDRAVPFREDSGKIAAWIGSSTDIDDRKTAEIAMADANAVLEQRVAERSAELDRIFKLSTDIFTVTRFDGYVLSVNPAWEQITGHAAQEILTRPFIDFVHPDDVERTQQAFANLIDGHPLSIENRYRRADGSWCRLAWRAVPQLDQWLIYSVARDITAEREREEQLRQSQKMEVVGQLTGGVAHDFNNLLTIILGSLELLLRGMPAAEPKIARRIETAMEAAKRAAALTHRLLAFSRRQPLTPKPLDANRLLAGMSDMLHRTLGETIAVRLVSAAGLWPVLADANQLENAILNLAVNARDAMPAGGQLSIETENTYLDDTYAAMHPDVQPGQYVLIAVSDAGNGMSAEVKSKIFEPFFTTKPPGQGTGLGLAQVYGFIKQSGGHVSVYSELGEGTTVKIYLPRHGTAAKADQPAAPDNFRHLSSDGETILVVEDEVGVRNFSSEVLAELGYNVLTAETAAEALKCFEAAPAIKLLFTDVVLGGGVNGRQLADEIRRLHPGVIVLFTTGYTRNAIVHHGRLDDGINFIGKPFTATALGEKVAQLLERDGVKSSH